MNTLLSRFSLKPKINHYEKYSDIIRTSKNFHTQQISSIFPFFFIDPKRTVPVKNIDTIRKKLTQPWASWRIDRLTTYLTDLVRSTKLDYFVQNRSKYIDKFFSELHLRTIRLY